MNHKETKQKGFTLIELLVVIAIIAILSLVVVLAINPVELLRQARDSTRLSDLQILSNAVSLYLSSVSSPSITDNSAYCYMSLATSSCGGRYVNAPTATSSKSGVFSVDGSGWVPVNFNSMISGSPVGKLPKDPVNTAGGTTSTNLYYSYAASSTGLVFEFDAKMESLKYSASGTSDVESTDGGPPNTYNLYEIGTILNY